MSVQIRIILVNRHALFVAIQELHRSAVLGPAEFIQAAVGAAHCIAVLAVGKPLAQKGAFGHLLFILFRIKNRLCPLCPVFFVNSLILLKFFIVLNKRKNWETGQKCENPLIFLGFLLPTFVLKTGQKLGRNWAEALFQRFRPSIFQ